MNKQNCIILVVVLVLVGLLGLFFVRQQPSSPPASAPAPEIPAEYQKIAEDAVNIVKSTLHVPADEVTVLSVQQVTWGDSSLGCPEPDQMYAQTATPGYLVTTQVSDQTQSVHMNENGKGLVCPSDQAQPPASTE